MSISERFEVGRILAARQPNRNIRYAGSGRCRRTTVAANLATSAASRIASIESILPHGVSSPRDDRGEQVGGALALGPRRRRDASRRARCAARAPTPAPRPPGRARRPPRRPAARPSRNITMLVCTVARSSATPRQSGEPLGDQPRIGMVVGEPRRRCGRARRARPPRGCPLAASRRRASGAPAPPRRCRPALPASTLPTGQPSPFDSATETRSNGAASSAEALPGRDRGVEQPGAVEIAARCRAPRAAAQIATASACGNTMPPPRLCVFSIATRARSAGRRCGPRGLQAARKSAAVNSPPCADDGELHARHWPRRRPASCHIMCASSPTITSSPGRVSSFSAIWLAIVPLGTNSAASLPSSSAIRCLQPVDRRVLAILVVADRRLGHRPPHAGRGPGDGIGAQVDRLRLVRSSKAPAWRNSTLIYIQSA